MRRIFKNKAVQVSVVDRPKDGGGPPKIEENLLDEKTVKLIAERSKEFVKYTALTLVGAYAVIKTIDTVSQIALKKTRSADQD